MTWLENWPCSYWRPC